MKVLLLITLLLSSIARADTWTFNCGGQFMIANELVDSEGNTELTASHMMGQFPTYVFDSKTLSLDRKSTNENGTMTSTPLQRVKPLVNDVKNNDILNYSNPTGRTTVFLSLYEGKPYNMTVVQVADFERQKETLFESCLVSVHKTDE